jgi:hypothetical protein
MALLQRINIASFCLLYQPLCCVYSPLYGHSFVLQSKHFVCSVISDTEHITHSPTLNYTRYVAITLLPEPNDVVNVTACMYGVVSSQGSRYLCVKYDIFTPWL